MVTARLFKLALLSGAILLVGCGPGSPAQSHGGPVRDHVSFVDALRGKGLTVDIVGNVTQPFLHPHSGTALRISGSGIGPAEVQSFDYASSDAASADAGQIQPNGSIKSVSVDWIAPPHFFRKERVLVIYLGTDRQVLSLLSGVLGPSFAG